MVCPQGEVHVTVSPRWRRVRGVWRAAIALGDVVVGHRSIGDGLCGAGRWVWRVVTTDFGGPSGLVGVVQVAGWMVAGALMLGSVVLLMAAAGFFR